MQCLGVYRPPPLAGCKAQRPLVQIDVWLSSSTPLVFSVGQLSPEYGFHPANVGHEHFDRSDCEGEFGTFNRLYVTCGQRSGLNHPQHKIHNQSAPVTESESSPQLNTISHLFVAIGATGTWLFAFRWYRAHLSVQNFSCWRHGMDVANLIKRLPSDRTMMWMIAIIGYYYDSDVYSYHHMSLYTIIACDRLAAGILRAFVPIRSGVAHDVSPIASTWGWFRFWGGSIGWRHFAGSL